jgi:hypothetical protein
MDSGYNQQYSTESPQQYLKKENNSESKDNKRLESAGDIMLPVREEVLQYSIEGFCCRQCK